MSADSGTENSLSIFSFAADGRSKELSHSGAGSSVTSGHSRHAQINVFRRVKGLRLLFNEWFV